MAQIGRDLDLYPTGRSVYVRHSNTAIYAPLLYAAAIAGVTIAKVTGAPIGAWLYAGRVANVLLGGLLVWLALRRAGGAAPYLLVIATLPILLFETASLSADALLLPALILFAAGIARLSTGVAPDRWTTGSTALMAIVIGVGKVAYLPFVFVPPLIARTVDRRWSRRALALLAAAGIAAVAWGAWAAVVNGKVFSIIADRIVDPSAQLRFVLGHPSAFAASLAMTSVVSLPRLFGEALGSHLGWLEFGPPPVFMAAAMVVVLGSAIFADRASKPARRVVVIAVAAALLCYIAVLTLLYLQFNGVGARFIEGMQGRYLTPLLIVLLSVTPRWSAPPVLRRWSGVILPIWTVATAVATVATVAHRYWV